MKLINMNTIKTTPKKLGVSFKMMIILLEFQKKKRGVRRISSRKCQKSQLKYPIKDFQRHKL